MYIDDLSHSTCEYCMSEYWEVGITGVLTHSNLSDCKTVQCCLTVDFPVTNYGINFFWNHNPKLC